MKTLGLWGVVRNGTTDGYGYAGFKMVESLNRLGFKVLWEEEDSPVALSFIQPEMYGGCAHQYRIGYTPWESTVIKEGWAERINKMDEFWTTSTFCKEVFEEQGVELPIKVVPHGIDTEEWTLKERSFDENQFVFLHIGEPAERKGSQLVFNAFKEVFAGNPNVHLVFKTAASWMEARWFDSEGSIIGPVDQWPNVHIIRGLLTQAQLDELYGKVHCVVYPSNGEGFGLIPFQGAATGLPVIAPTWGGIGEFGQYLTNPLKYTVGPSNHGYHLGEWCFPDFEDLCAQMAEVYDDYGYFATEAYSKGKSLREAFEWDTIFKPIVEDLSRLYDS